MNSKIAVGVLIFLFGIISSFTSSRLVDAAPTDFLGTWVNVDQETRGLTALNIVLGAAGFEVQGFGQCHPTDCDWGFTALNFPDDSTGDTNITRGEAVWDFGFSETTLVIHLEGDQLVAETYTIFKDDSGRPNYRALYLMRRSQPSVTKQETVGLDILQSNNIPLENLTVSTLLSEDVLATGETTASVTVADVNKGQIAFVSNIDGNPFVVAYIPAADIQNGTTSITLDSIADGFIMSNPLMFGFRHSDRLAILSYAKNVPLYQDLKQEINTALQTDPYNLLKDTIFQKTYEDATLLIIDAIRNIGGEALSRAVVEAVLDATRNAIIGQTDVPHLNDLGGGKIEAVNPTMLFYGFDIAEQPGQARIIRGKKTWWDLNLGWPPQLPQFTNPVKETIDLGADGRFNITFSKTGPDDVGNRAAAANLLKLGCILLDVVFYCPASNKTIEVYVEGANDQILASVGNHIWSLETPKKIFVTILDLLTEPGLNGVYLWPKFMQVLYRNAVDRVASINFLKGSKKLLKRAVRILQAYDAANEYAPFVSDGITKPNNVKYCVTEANGVLTANCQPPPPPPVEPSPEEPPPPTVPAAPSDLSLAITSGGHGIGVGWKDNSDNESGFDISYSPDPNINTVEHLQVEANQTFLSSDWGLSSDQDGLLSGQTMCFQVSAYNADGSSAPTAWSCITVP